MSIPIFLTVCAFSVAFLVYVLAQFWREGHRPRDNFDTVVFSRPWNPNVVVVTHPISLSAQGGISVMPLQPHASRLTAVPAQGGRNRRVLQMPASDAPREQRRVAGSSKTRSSLKVS